MPKSPKKQPTGVAALQKIIDQHDGMPSKLGIAIGKTQNLVHTWLARGRIPAEPCLYLEQASRAAAPNDAVTVEMLRPDLPWHVIRGSKA